MKTYLDLQAIEHTLPVKIELEPVGTPDLEISVDQSYHRCRLFNTVLYEFKVPLLCPFVVTILLKDKKYNLEHETAIKIKTLQVDGVDLVPRFDYMAVYSNDHDNNDPTSYLGFNGKWTLTIDKPFYQWLHQATAQGWLIG